MRMISEQVKELMELAGTFEGKRLGRILNAAVITIEELSAKVSAHNIERSTAYYNNGWIPCSERLPVVELSERTKSGECSDNGENFLITDSKGFVYESTFWAVKQKFEDDAIAWIPLPERYQPK